MEYCNVSIIDGKIVINDKNIIKKHKIIHQQVSNQRVIVQNDVPYVITVKEELQEYFANEESSPDNQEGVESSFVSYEEIIKEETACPDCMMEFSTIENLQEHINACHTAHRCDICFRQLKSKSGLDRHLKSHLKPTKFFECEICHAKISRRIEFKKHLMNHNIGTRYVCELCPYVCTSKRGLHDHHVNFHMKNFKPLRFLPCKKCILSFRSRDAYDEHQLYHSKMEQMEEN
ncbi:unnamed protein product [Chironomus riparius]|uniref:C2H2-type domain-containing protein n=1 Tax=Chironomus riparius TaxID=315576 RepID=A0A9N9RLM5_9DIPT|nr:unnamed protein product [Chironomus riparius]